MNIRKKVLLNMIPCLLLACFALAGTSTAQTTFAKYYGGYDDDGGYSIVQASDGGYAFAGNTFTFGIGSQDEVVMKLNTYGNIIWRRTFGGTSDESARSIVQTSDGGYIITGYSNSVGAGIKDALIIKLNASGNILWRRTFGGTHDDDAFAIAQATDGGYFVAGSTYSFGAGGSDVLVMKLNSSGNILWRRTFGGSANEFIYALAKTSDGGCILTGNTHSYGAGSSDVLVIKLNASGNILWRRVFGGTDADSANAIAQTSDGGYVIGATTSSFGDTYGDILVIKLTSTGNISWRRTFGGTHTDATRSIVQTSDGGYVLTGLTASFGAGSYDAFIIKLSSSGNVLWKRTFGSTNIEYGSSIAQTSDGGYILAGGTESFGYGNEDMAILKLDSNGIIPGCSYFDSPSLTVAAPAISSSAPALGATAPVLSVSAPQIYVVAANIMSGTICP